MWSFCSKSQYVKQNKLKLKAEVAVSLWTPVALTPESYSRLVRRHCFPCLERTTSIHSSNNSQESMPAGCPMSSTQRHLHVCSYRSATLRHRVLEEMGWERGIELLLSIRSLCSLRLASLACLLQVTVRTQQTRHRKPVLTQVSLTHQASTCKLHQRSLWEWVQASPLFQFQKTRK